MDWEKVIANLRSQTNFYTEKANECAMHSAYHEPAREYRQSANVASILASALAAGLTVKTS